MSPNSDSSTGLRPGPSPLSPQLPGELETAHHGLLEQQDQVEDDRELLGAAETLITEARTIGATLEDPQVRKRCQSILDYWAIFIYRVDRKDVDAELLPFDPSQSTSLEEIEFPYNFSVPPGEGQDLPLQGWRRLLDECERDLSQFRFLTVVSDPGSGGRTLVHKLLLPTLRGGRARRDELAGSDRWRYYTVTFHDHPLRELLTAIAEQDGHDDTWVQRRHSELRSDPKRLLDLLQDDSQPPAVLICRRFNTLLRLSESERAVVCQALDHLLQDPLQRFYAIATLGRGHATQFSRFEPLQKRLREGHVLLTLTTAELRHFIEEPARRVGLSFDPGLIDQLLIDIQGEATAVPLLQFTLKRLWDRRERNRIPWQAYEHVGAGRTAVSRAMQAIYEDLSPAQQVALRHVLLSMVVLEPGDDFRTCEISREELANSNIQPTDLEYVIERLRQQDLLYQRRLEDQFEYSLTHPTMLTGWRPLVEWLDEMRVGERFRLRLKESAEHWSQRGRPSDLVWRGAMLLEADEEINDGLSLSNVERDFLTAGRSREAWKQRRRWAGVGLVFTAVLAVVIGYFVFQNKQRALENARRNLESELELIKANQDKQAAEQKQFMETKQRMFSNAVDALRRGDLPGELLWLNAHAEVKNPSDTDSASQKLTNGTQMRKLAEMQLAELENVLIARRWAPGYDENVHDSAEEPKFVAMASESFGKQTLLAVLLRRLAKSPQASTKFELEVYVQPPNQELQSLPLEPALSITSTSGGAIAFCNSDPKQPCVLAAGDGVGLKCWQAKTELGSQWNKLSVEFSPAASGYAPTDLVVEGDYLLTSKSSGNAENPPQFRLWKMELDSAKSTLKLTKSDLPGDFKNAAVKTASLSENGMLVGLCCKEPDQELASAMRIWMRADSKDTDSPWESLAAPNWVSKQEYQRLHNWGWQFNVDAKHWERIGSDIRAVAISPSGQHIVTACGDGQVLVWNTAKTVMPLMESELQLGSSVFAVKFLNENVIITGGRDRTARMWNIHNRAEVVPPAYHEGTVNSVDFVSNDTLITNTTRQIRVWQSNTYSQTLTPIMVDMLTNSGDQKSIAYHSSDDTTPDFPDFVSAYRLNALPGRTIQKIGISKKGTWQCTIARGDEDSKLSVKRLESSTTKSKDETARLQETATIEETIFAKSEQGSTAEHPNQTLTGPPLVAFAPSENWLAVLSPSSNQGTKDNLLLWDLDAVEKADPLSIASNENQSFSFNQMAFSSHAGTQVLAIVGKVEYDESDEQAEKTAGCIHVCILDTSTDKPLWKVKRLMLADGDDPHTEPALSVAFSADGQILATGDKHDRVKLWDVGALLDPILPNENTLPSQTTIEVQKLCELKHSSDVEQLVFVDQTEPTNPVQLATISSEGEASLWSLSKGGRTARLQYKLRHEAKILTLRFSSDSRWIVTGGEDRTARVWDAGAGQLVGVLKHAGAVEGAWFVNNQNILTASRSPTVDVKDQFMLQVRHWYNPTEEHTLSVEQLRRVAARQVTDDDLDLERWLPVNHQQDSP